MSKPTSLIGANDASKILDRSIKSVHRYVEQGSLKPAGRLGSNKNSAVVFDEDVVRAFAAKLGT